MSSDYSGELVEVEVGRYGLRTFRHIPAEQAEMTAEQFWQVQWRSMLWGDEIGQYGSDGPMVLCSTAMSGRHWDNGVCEASCQMRRNPHQETLVLLAALTEGVKPVYGHEAPQEGCHCGIYAAHTLQILRDQFPDRVRDIVAVVAAEGQTIIGTKGFRTERARVVAYWCSEKVAPTAAEQFAEAERFGDVSAMLTEYGLEDGRPPGDLMPLGINASVIGSDLTQPWIVWSDKQGKAQRRKGRRSKVAGVGLNASLVAVNMTMYVMWHQWANLAAAVFCLAMAAWILRTANA